MGYIYSKVDDKVGVVYGINDYIKKINIKVKEIRESKKLEIEDGMYNMYEELKKMKKDINDMVEKDEISIIMYEIKEDCDVRNKKKEYNVDEKVYDVENYMRVEEVSLKKDEKEKK